MLMIGSVKLYNLPLRNKYWDTFFSTETMILAIVTQKNTFAIEGKRMDRIVLVIGH